MKRSTAAKALMTITAAAALIAPAGASAALTSSQKAAVQKLGADAFTYGYAPVYMEHNISRFPANTVISVQYLATDLTRSIVKPNADTLYTIMVLDVAKDPVIIHTPATGSRYFGLELLDGYTNVTGYIPCINGSASTTSTCKTKSVGTTAADYAIVGPTWKNSGLTKLKKTVKKIIKSATPRVWIIGRTLVDSEADLPNAVAIQNGVTAQLNSKVTASQFLPRLNLVTPGPMATPAGVTPDANFFKEFGDVTKAQPPLSVDSSLMAKLKVRGIGPGRDPSKTQSAEVMTELVKGAVSANAALETGVQSKIAASRVKRNGWILFDGVGAYGKDYLTRALIAKFGLGANNPAEAVYPAAVTDYSGATLNGAAGALYKIHFDAGQAPPNTGGFWSITMYAEDQYFVPNSINRFAIGNRTPGLKYNNDGSLDLYLSATQPDEVLGGSANWLPAPSAQFNLMFRIYRPTASVLNDTWKYPKITKLPT